MKDDSIKLKETLNPRNACIYKERLFFYQDSIQSLCSVNMNLNDLKIEKMIHTDTPFYVFRIINIDNSLFLFDAVFTQAYKYNLATGEFTQLLKKGDKDESFLIVAAYFYLDKIYLVSGFFSKHIIVFDVKQNRFYRDNQFGKAIADYADKSEMIITFPTFDSEVMTFAIWKTSTVFSYNLISSQFEMHKYPNEYKINTILKKDCGLIFTVTDKTSIYYINDCDIEEIYLGHDLKQAYSRICCLKNDKILLLSRYGKKMLFIDGNKMNIEEVELFPDIKESGPSHQNFIIEYEDYIYAFPFDGSESIFRYEIEKKNLECYKIECDEDNDEIVKMLKRTFGNRIVEEQSKNDLEIWINYVVG